VEELSQKIRFYMKKEKSTKESKFLRCSVTSLSPEVTVGQNQRTRLLARKYEAVVAFNSYSFHKLTARFGNTALALPPAHNLENHPLLTAYFFWA
jgi:hypothetical protein